MIINGVECGKLYDREQTRMRRMEIGFVYQFHHLLPEFSALENVVLPQLILGLTREKAEARAQGAARLARARGALGSPPGATLRRRAAARRDRPRARQRPQGAARRRADRQSRSTDRRARIRAAAEARARSGVAAVIATHNLDLAARMDRILRLSDGLLVEEEVVVAKVATN